MRILKPLPGILPMPGRPLANAVGLWPMNSLGNRIFDLSGNGSIGTFENDTVWDSGKFGSAVKFDGTADRIGFGDRPVLEVVKDITVICWLNPSSHGANYKSAVSYRSGTAAYQLWESFGGDSKFGVTTAGGSVSGKAPARVSLNTCSQLVGVYDGANVTCYVNGVSGTPVAQTGNIVYNSPDIFEIGGYTGQDAQSMQGLIESVSVYNRALSASEFYREPFCMFPENIMPEFAISA